MKLEKRLIALVLSFVMVFGCIPSFVTESWAAQPTLNVTVDTDLSLEDLDDLEIGAVSCNGSYGISTEATRRAVPVEGYPGGYFIDTIIESSKIDDVYDILIDKTQMTFIFNSKEITESWIDEEEYIDDLDYFKGNEIGYFFEDDKLIIRQLYDFGIHISFENEPTNDNYHLYNCFNGIVAECDDSFDLDFDTDFMLSLSSTTLGEEEYNNVTYLSYIVGQTGVDPKKVQGKWLSITYASLEDKDFDIDDYVISVNEQIAEEIDVPIMIMDTTHKGILEEMLKPRNLDKYYYFAGEFDDEKCLFIFKWYDFSITERITINSLTPGTVLEDIGIFYPDDQEIDNCCVCSYDELGCNCLDRDAKLENGINYLLYLKLIGGSASAINSLYINGTELESVEEYYLTHNGPYSVCNVNDPSVYRDGVDCCTEYSSLWILYKFKPQTPTSKKYKASDSSSDGSADISGSGKKNSTRTITPDENKTVKEVIVTDKKGNPVDVIDNGDGTYSFKQPASDVVVEVIYDETEKPVEKVTTEQEEKLHEELLDTSDVKEVSSSSNKDKINTEATFIKGYDDGSFKPNEEVSNIELMSMVSELFNAEAKQGGETLDLNQGDNAWADDVISSCNKLGLVPGNKNSKNYDLSGSVSRGDLAIVIYDLVKDYTPSEKLKDTDSCSDVIGTKYEEAVTKLKELGILKGFDDNKYHYDLALSRAEAVVVINRALKSLGVKMSASDIKKSFGDLSKDHWAYDEIMNAAN